VDYSPYVPRKFGVSFRRSGTTCQLMERIPSADSNIGHGLPAVKKATQPLCRSILTTASPKPDCRDESGENVPKRMSCLASGASLRFGLPHEGEPLGLGRDYIQVMLAKQTISKGNAVCRIYELFGMLRRLARNSWAAAKRPIASQRAATAAKQITVVAPGLPLILLARNPNSSAPRIGKRETETPTSESMTTAAASEARTIWTGRGRREPAFSHA